MIISKNTKNSAVDTARILSEGGIVIIPTDTVYGFSGIVDTDTSVPYSTDTKIRSIKGRSEQKPLIQLIAKPQDIYQYTDDVIPSALLDKWPGALTIIVNTKSNAPLSKEAKLPTIAFRCPGDAWLREVISLCKAPVFSTSVNRSGQPVLDTINAIKSEFENEVNLIIDDGDKPDSLPSTLVRLENGNIKVLRQGSVRV